ncbi:MAG TPA: aminotransferase class I/II-fold pyridoxal phosphate-dependent enzyme [Archaeoglobus profundus]|nr:aminotransferase class I/II-fold pyridoxal phosphate-dependent enzyme [Archaeoglobus profundus]
MKKIGGSHLSHRVSERVNSIKPSGIRKFFDLVMSRQDIISLGVGEPDFPVPWRIRDEMIYSLERGITSYTPNQGLLELREAIAEYYKKFGLNYVDVNNIIVTTGVSEGIDIALRAILNPGDIVLIPEPAYVSYKPLTILAGGEPLPIPTVPEFKLNYEIIAKYCKEKPKAIILNYPNNPTGVSYSKKELEEIADAIIEFDLIVISDEIYAELTYDGKHISIASLNGMEDRTIVLNGFSKAFAMTGFRIGYTIAPPDIHEAMLKIHQYCMLCAPVTAQIGALEALRNCEKELEEMREEYMRRRNFFVKRLKNLFDVKKPDGAFYVFPRIDNTGLSSEEFAEKLLVERGVAVIPGNAFGECGEGYIRCAYAVSMEKLKEAVDRIDDFIKKL